VGVWLVKWFLAIPHFVVLVLLWLVFVVLTVVAFFAILVTGRYPEPLFDLLVGLNRWVYRVTAYVALMTDTNPPFRLDQGPATQMPSRPRRAPPTRRPRPVPAGRPRSVVLTVRWRCDDACRLRAPRDHPASGAGSTESSRPSAGPTILLALLGLGAMASALLGPLARGWIDHHVSSGAADQLRGGDVAGLVLIGPVALAATWRVATDRPGADALALAPASYGLYMYTALAITGDLARYEGDSERWLAIRTRSASVRPRGRSPAPGSVARSVAGPVAVSGSQSVVRSVEVIVVVVVGVTAAL
jgi:hypothetical protein